MWGLSGLIREGELSSGLYMSRLMMSRWSRTQVISCRRLTSEVYHPSNLLIAFVASMLTLRQAQETKRTALLVGHVQIQNDRFV